MLDFVTILTLCMLVSTVLSADYLGRQFRCTSDPIELGLNLNCLTLMIILKEFSKINGKKTADNTKSQKKHAKI